MRAKHVCQTLCQAPGSQHLTDTEIRSLPVYNSATSISGRCAHSALGTQAVLKMETTKQQRQYAKDFKIFVSLCTIDIVGTQLLNPAKLSLL